MFILVLGSAIFFAKMPKKFEKFSILWDTICIRRVQIHINWIYFKENKKENKTG